MPDFCPSMDATGPLEMDVCKGEREGGSHRVGSWRHDSSCHADSAESASGAPSRAAAIQSGHCTLRAHAVTPQALPSSRLSVSYVVCSLIAGFCYLPRLPAPDARAPLQPAVQQDLLREVTHLHLRASSYPRVSTWTRAAAMHTYIDGLLCGSTGTCRCCCHTLCVGVSLFAMDSC